MFVFSKNDRPHRSFSTFLDMKRIGELCDVTLNVEQQSFCAHRIILASAIPYFRRMFASGMRETRNKEISLNSLHPKAVESIINYAYGIEISLSEDYVLPLLMTSSFMQVEELQDACAGFLSERIRCDNVVTILIAADSINQQNLIDRSIVYMQNYFEELSRSQDFTDIPYQYFKNIIRGYVLDTTNEEAVFEAVIKWVKALPSERHILLPELLNEVRMTKFTLGYLLKQVKSEKLLTSSIQCKNLVKKAKSYPPSKKEGLRLESVKSIPRLYINDAKLYAVGIDRYGCSVHYYSPFYFFKKPLWKCLGQSSYIMEETKYAAVVNQKIYVFGNKSVQIFHLRTRKWEILKIIKPWTRGGAFVLHGNNIYCFGSGNSAYRRTKHVFDTQQNRWLEDGTMETERSHSAATSLEDFIYITGGESAVAGNTAEKYNPSTDHWEKIASMPVRRCQHACTSVNGKIYVFGGSEWCSSEVLNHPGLMYDPNTDSWNIIDSRNILAGYRLSVISTSNYIFALGIVQPTGAAFGYVLEFALSWYDLENDEWLSVLDLPQNGYYDFSKKLFLVACSREGSWPYTKALQEVGFISYRR